MRQTIRNMVIASAPMAMGQNWAASQIGFVTSIHSKSHQSFAQFSEPDPSAN